MSRVICKFRNRMKLDLFFNISRISMFIPVKSSLFEDMFSKIEDKKFKFMIDEEKDRKNISTGKQ